MLRSCVCATYDRYPVCLSEESAAVMGGARQEGGTPFPHPRAADCFRSPFTASHATNVSANMDHNSPLDGGGLYALRAGRSGCDSLSLAGSRQRVKSLRSAVRLHLVIITARSILSRSVLHSADAALHTHLPRARRKARLLPAVADSPEVSLRDVFMSGLAVRRCGQFPRYAETVRIPLVPRSSAQTLLRSTAFRGVI